MADEQNGGNEGERSGEAWREAAETTRRVRRMVNEVLEVLRETASEADYGVPVSEVIESANGRIAELAREAGVTVRTSMAGGDMELAGNTAALSGLVLHNLLENAVAATSRGGEIGLEWGQGRGEGVWMKICDTGTGLPPAVRAADFAPVVSSKLGGAGLGLALSHQLARHAGGQLRVVKSDANGTCFSLEVPLRVKAKIEAKGILK